MDMNNFLGGQYLAKTDVTTSGTDVVIAAVLQDVIGDEQTLKAILEFKGPTKSMVLNKTNIRILCALFGNDSNQWIGRTINVYNDVTVVFNGSVGGIRVRPSPLDASGVKIAQNALQEPTGASYAAEQVATAQSMATAPPNDDIPFSNYEYRGVA